MDVGSVAVASQAHCADRCANGFLTAFGLEINADFALPGLTEQPGPPTGRRLWLRQVDFETLIALDSHPRHLRHLRSYQDCPYAALEGDDGDLLFHLGSRAMFYLTPDQTTVLCARADSEDRHWQRVFLDTVLWTVSLQRGLDLLHASVVQTRNGLIAVMARSGGGKSSLAAEYLSRGATLFSDDILAVEPRDHGVVAHPGPPVLNLPKALPVDTVNPIEVLADFGEELWVRVRSDERGAQPLSAIVLLNRTASGPARCTPVAPTSLTLLPHRILLPHMTARSRQQFEVFGALVATTPALQLTADPSTPTTELADLVDQRIAAGG